MVGTWRGASRSASSLAMCMRMCVRYPVCIESEINDPIAWLLVLNPRLLHEK